MKYFNKKTGSLAEDLATQALKNKGYQILERNFSNKFGEIDIIAKEGDVLVFVEVKAKTGLDFGMPEEMITRNKLQRIQHMAAVYTNGKTTIESGLCRIDVIAVVLSPTNETLRLTHYENVYL